MSGVLVVSAPERDLTRLEAEEATARVLRSARKIEEYVTDYLDAVVQAWALRADEVLGYPTWRAYCDDRFAALRDLRIPLAMRRELVAHLWDAGLGLSKRGISAALQVGDKTVREDLEHRERALRVVPDPQPADDGQEAGEVPAPLSQPAQALADLAAAGPRGMTSGELGRAHREWDCPWAVLSRLHRQHRVHRLAGVEASGTRAGLAVYVAAEHTAGRATEAPGRARNRGLPSAG